MFEKWRRKREAERLRANCPHDWYKVREFRGEKYDGFGVEFYDAATIYCPICDVRKTVTAARAEEILGIREIRKQYENGGESNG